MEFNNQNHKNPHQNGKPAGGMPEETGFDFFQVWKNNEVKVKKSPHHERAKYSPSNAVNLRNEEAA